MKAFAGVIKYHRHISEEFCKGSEESWKTFAGVIKYLRHILEGFRTGNEGGPVGFRMDHEMF